MPPPRLRMRLLGGPALWLDEREVQLPQAKLVALLGYLAVRGESVPRAEVAELLWGHGRGQNLRMALYKLRQLPESASWLLATDDRLELELDTDLRALEDALANERFDAVLREPPEGGLLEGVEGDTDAYRAWLADERQRVDALTQAALVGAAQAAERRGDLDAAVGLARRLTKRDPFDEAVLRMNLRLEQGRGHTEAALWQFERFRRSLRDELGTEPEASTLELVHDIERGLLSASERAQRLDSADAVWFRPPRLLGREALIGDVLSALEKGGWVQLHGLGGVGKTTVAAEVAARWLANGGGSVLWATAAGDDAEALTDTLARALDDATPGPDRAAAMAADGAVTSMARATDKVDALRTLLGAAGIGLMVLDDARNPYVLGRALEAMPTGVSVLVTARRRYGGLARMAVDGLAPDDGLALLELHAGRTLGQAGDLLCARLGAHPLALRLAGARLRRQDVSVEDVLAEAERALDSLRLPPDEAQHGPASLAGLLEASLQTVSDAAFEAFLAAGALFAPSVTAELLARLARRPAEEVEEALFELSSLALTERLAEPGRDLVRYRLHDLAFTFARSRGNLRPRTAVGACLEHARANAGNLDTLDADIANLSGAAAEASRGRQPEALVGILKALAVDGPYLEARGPTPRMLALLQLAAEAAEDLQDLRSAHHLYSKLGNLQRERNADFEAALASYQRALELANELGDADREAILTCITGVTLHYLGREGARPRLDKALRIARERGAPTTLLHVLQNVSGVAGMLGEVERALAYAEEAVRTARALVASDGQAGPALVYALLNQAEALRDLERLADAKAPLEEALEAARGLGHGLLEGFACQALGELQHAVGDTAAAQDLLRDAYDLYRESHAGAELAKLDERWRALGLGDRVEG